MSNNKLIIVALSIIFTSLLSCQTTPETEQAIKLMPFFDLETFFEKEIEILKSTKKVEKTAMINGETETKTLKDLDFSQELAIFTQSNINKTAWLDKYAIDSVYNAQKQLVQLNYTAKEERLRTREVIISFENKEITKVEVQNATKNIIAQSQQNLVYVPKKGYTIKSEQDIVFSEPREMVVEVMFR